MGWKPLCVVLLGALVACGGDASSPDASRDAGWDVPPFRDAGPVDAGRDEATRDDGDAGDGGASEDVGPERDVTSDAAGEVPAACLEPDAPLELGGIVPAYALPAPFGRPFLEKNAFLLALFETVPGVSGVLASGDLGALGASRATRFLDAVDVCADRGCVLAAATWSGEEIAAAGALLAQTLVPAEGVAGFVQDHVRPSGRFHLHRALPDAGLLEAAWADTMGALSNAAVRFAGEAAPGDADAAIAAVRDAVAALDPEDRTLHQVLMALVEALATAAGRDEAARYEPLEEGENAAAVARIPTLDWDAWPYTVILVPGWGPTDLETPLSQVGAEHCDLAVLRWQAGWAPFIAVSGGHVHPDRTPYSEAIEMKRYLMDVYDVPEEAILVDPHARHTTTNLRNVGRLVFRYGIPPERPLVTTTDFLQSGYITALGGRCLDELGYLPWRAINALTLEDNCLFVSPDVLYADPRDPLDP